MMSLQFAVGVTVLLALMPPHRAYAQGTVPERPYRGLFGGDSRRSEGDQPLSLRLTLAQAFDGNVFGNSIGVDDVPKVSRGGQYTSLTADVSWGARARRLQVTTAARSSARYYGGADQLTSISYDADAGLSVQLPRRTRLTLNQNFGYTPSYLARLFPAVESEALEVSGELPPDYAADQEQGFTSFTTMANLTHGLTRRGMLTVSGDLRHSEYAMATLRAYGGRAQYSQGLTRNAALRLGYGFREGTSGYSTPRTRAHDIDLGVDYNRSLSFSRRTNVGFTFGSSLLRTPLRDDIGESPRLQYRAVGDAWLNHLMGRTWSAWVRYQRGVGFIEGIADPVFTDGVRAAFGGRFNRRATFSSLAAYSKGESALIRGEGGFNTFTGSARVGFALLQSLSTFADYTYYSYAFSPDIVTLDAAPRKLERNVVRVGLSFWTSTAGR